MRKSISERLNGNTIQVYNNSIKIIDEYGQTAGVITGVTPRKAWSPRKVFDLNDKIKAAGFSRDILFCENIKLFEIQGDFYALYCPIYAGQEAAMEAAQKFFGDKFITAKVLNGYAI